MAYTWTLLVYLTFMTLGKSSYLIHSRRALILCLASAQDDGGSSGGDSSNTLELAHAIIASLTWVIFFPVGAIAIRLIRSSNAVWIHATIQGTTLLLLIASVVTGILLAQQSEQVRNPKSLRFCPDIREAGFIPPHHRSCAIRARIPAGGWRYSAACTLPKASTSNNCQLSTYLVGSNFDYARHDQRRAWDAPCG